MTASAPRIPLRRRPELPAVSGAAEPPAPKTIAVEGPAPADTWAEIAFHPVAEIFPMMAEADLASLAADIAAHGLREAIWRHRDGRIIDGRNRYLACRQAKMPPVFRVYEGADAALIDFVVSLNVERRHMSESQRAIVAARIANLKIGRQESNAPIGAFSQAVAAKQLSVGMRTIQRAKNILAKGTAEEIAAVERARPATVTRLAEQGRRPPTIKLLFPAVGRANARSYRQPEYRPARR